MRYFTSDLHLGHERIIDLVPRPFVNADDMNDQIIDYLAGSIRPGDELWILGDIAMGKPATTLPLLEMIPCDLHLILGNHDKGHPLFGSKRRLAPYEALSNVKFIGIEATIKIGGIEVEINHFPYSGDEWERDDHRPYYPNDYGRWLLHGHVHGQWFQNGKQINVGVDAAPWLQSDDDVEDIILNSPRNRPADLWTYWSQNLVPADPSEDENDLYL